MAKLQVSYSEAQRHIRENLGLPDDCEIVIERKDAQDRRERRSGPPASQMADSNIQR
jgi:hypothetical protein